MSSRKGGTPKASAGKQKNMILQEIKKLDQEDEQAAAGTEVVIQDHQKRVLYAVSAASLAMLAQNADSMQPDLLEAIPKLVTIMQSQTGALQRNACVAIIAIVHAGEAFWKIAGDEGVVSTAVALMGSPKQEIGMRLNAAVLAGAMIEGGSSGPDDFYRENGLDALTPLLAPETDSQLLEAAVDLVCKLASDTTARKPLSDAGTVGRLANLTGLQEQPETLVRVLMGLAMLLGSSPTHLQEFAQAPGAIHNLASIIRSSEDNDSKAIATSIFANLAHDVNTRETVSQMLSSSKAAKTN